MVCNRCITAVEAEFSRLGIMPLQVRLGEVELLQALTPDQHTELENRLTTLGFELLDDARTRLIEKIKTLVIEIIQQPEPFDTHFNYSYILSQRLNKDYSTLSRLFSEVEGKTIEKYIILQKIEKVKELLAYDELTLSEIAVRLGYSSTAHLSAQFKKVTGLTTQHFRKMGAKWRKPLDKV